MLLKLNYSRNVWFSFQCMLGKVGNWNFDIFLFDRLTNGNSLVSLTFHLFSLHGLIEYFHLDMMKLRRFLVMIQEDYHSQNPYHNAVHAADVTQAMHCYLKEPKVRRRQFTGGEGPEEVPLLYFQILFLKLVI